jgi:formylglycine-generating enzyme required for sulfatase activity
MEPVGRLLPNDFGLFDIYGNVSEWNADIHPEGQQVATSGGAYHSQPEEVDSIRVDWTLPDLNYNRYGFRIARTVEPDELGRPR